MLLATLSLLPRQLTLLAFAEEAAHEEIVALANPAKAVEVSFPSGTNSKRDISVQLAYTDDLFARPAVEYNDKLGYASVCLAIAAGNSNLGGSDYTDKGRNISASIYARAHKGGRRGEGLDRGLQPCGCDHQSRRRMA